MECRNCSFNNTPGMAVCVRCQSRLDLRDVDYEPPRAGGPVALRHARWRLRAAGMRAGDGLRAAGDRARRALHPHVDWPSVVASIVPGLGHARQGHRRTAAALFSIWLALLLLAAANAGTGRGWLFVTGAVAFHCFVVSRVMAKALAMQPILRQVQAGLVVYLTLIIVLYGPALLLARGTARLLPVQGVLAGAAVADGDVLVYSGPWLRPKEWSRGDLVVYRIRPRSSSGVIVHEGWGVDRIVGLPGDLVVSEGSSLTVNGEVLEGAAAPLGGARNVPDIVLTPTSNQVLVFPSLLHFQGQGAGGRRLANDLARTTANVHQSDVAGKVWFRLRPWRRFGRITEGGAE